MKLSLTTQMKITYAAATSLDGFIAREDGDVSWLDKMNIDENETGLAAFFAGVDGLMMGRNTYDFIFDYGAWPYEDKPTWVCTQSELEPLKGANLIVVSDIKDVMEGAAGKGLEHLWLVGGGQLASAFLSQGLLTNVSISEMPIRLGTGIPLFAEHTLEEIPTENRNVIQKNGYRQIEIVIKCDRDTINQ